MIKLRLFLTLMVASLFSIPTVAQTDFTFDVTTYVNIYPDIKNVYGNNTSAATTHYYNWGLPSGRRAATSHPSTEPVAAKSQYLERIAVEMRGQVRVVPVKQIDYVAASGPYAELFVGDKRYLIRERMQTLEERLDPAKFFRIHRSAIVRIDLIETLIRNPGGDYGVQLKGGVKLKVSRGRFESLEELVGVKI